nr:hypothetical protein [Tanacetum cinerariifolium]
FGVRHGVRRGRTGQRADSPGRVVLLRQRRHQQQGRRRRAERQGRPVPADGLRQLHPGAGHRAELPRRRGPEPQRRRAQH